MSVAGTAVCARRPGDPARSTSGRATRARTTLHASRTPGPRVLPTARPEVLISSAPLRHACRGERVAHADIRLMARIFEQLIAFIDLPRNHDRPRPGPCFWVLDGGVV